MTLQGCKIRIFQFEKQKVFQFRKTVLNVWAGTDFKAVDSDWRIWFWHTISNYCYMKAHSKERKLEELEVWAELQELGLAGRAKL